MKFLEKFRERFPQEEQRELPLQERLKILQISEEALPALRNLVFEKIDVDDADYPVSTIVVLPVSRIVGLNRQDPVQNWLECLGKLHRKRNFELFTDRETFERFLLNEAYPDELPHVIDHDGKYYVSTNGKHRITFAKCLGIERLRVRVFQKAK